MASTHTISQKFERDKQDLLTQVRSYWNEHIHDLEIARAPIGSLAFFEELNEYRFDKLRYLPQLVDFNSFQGQNLLEIGCGVGIDLVRFRQGGADVTGVDLSDTAIELARKNFALRDLTASLEVMNGERLAFPDNTFDVVYAHGVLQYTANASNMIREIHRVLRPQGQAILMVYNRLSWLNAMSKLTKVDLEHEDAPVLKKFSIAEFRRLLKPFQSVRLVPERFPVKSRLHGGLKGALFNEVFVRGFNLVPRPIVRPLGWHLMAFAQKGNGAQ